MAAQQLISEGKATLIVVSLGAQGAILYSKTEKIQLPSPEVKARSTVGAGESMVAGIISVLANKAICSMSFKWESHVARPRRWRREPDCSLRKMSIGCFRKLKKDKN